jgi:hypothetical protein
MRKLPSYLDNPVDDKLLELCEILSPYFFSLHFTPNDITTLSLLFGLLSIYYLNENKVWFSVTCMFVSYFFDCFDGHYARKYKMISKFGDYYDHIKDAVVNLTFMFLLFKRNAHKLSNNERLVLLVIMLIMYALLTACFSCQEKIHDKADDAPTIGCLSVFISSKQEAERILGVLRFFGCGSFILFTLMLTVYLEYKK